MIKIKNQKIRKIMELEQRTDAFNKAQSNDSELLEQLSDENLVDLLLFGYVVSLADASRAISKNDKPELDLTYDTMNLFDNSIGALGYLMNSVSISIDDIRITLEKTIAAYYMLLAVNEHGLKLYFDRKCDIAEEDYYENGLWGPGLEITVGNENVKCDFLKLMLGNINFEENTLAVDTTEIRSAYKLLTGIDINKENI